MAERTEEKKEVEVALVVVAFVAVSPPLNVCATVHVLAAVVVAKYPVSADCARALVKYRFVLPSSRASVFVALKSCAKEVVARAEV